jgi:segregation and condensation protein A
MEEPGSTGRLQVATPVFEGPIELLLALAEREDVDILRVRLADLTDAYLRELAALERPDPVEMAEFLWTAARLLHLKSIRLLPGEEPDEPEAELLGWEEDVRLRLAEYVQYKEMARELMERVASEPFVFASPPRPVEVEGQEAPIDIDLLIRAFEEVLTRLPPRPLTVVGRTWSTDEKLHALTGRLARGPVELVGVLLECQDRLEAVVTFVALLELLRRGQVAVRQRQSFGPITVEWRGGK